MRKATSESWRISLSVSCDMSHASLSPGPCPVAVPRERKTRSLARSMSGGDAGARLEMLVRRAVLPLRERRPLARLPLARRRLAAGDAAVEGARLDLLLDEGDGRTDDGVHGPGDLRLARD